MSLIEFWLVLMDVDDGEGLQVVVSRTAFVFLRTCGAGFPRNTAKTTKTMLEKVAR
jgi:hypothetical protein